MYRQALLLRAAHFIPQPVLILGIALIQVQDLALLTLLNFRKFL